MCVRLSYWDKFYHNSINPVPEGEAIEATERQNSVIYKLVCTVGTLNIGGGVIDFIVRYFIGVETKSLD